MRFRRPASGITTTEFMFAILILALALIPIWDIFVGSYRNVFRSKFSYIAQHVARETVEELRQVAFDKVEQKAHDWEEVQGSVFKMTDLRSDVDRADATLAYPEDYKRIETRVTVEPLAGASGEADKNLKKVAVEVRWQEHGLTGTVSQKVLERFETIIANHKW